MGYKLPKFTPDQTLQSSRHYAETAIANCIPALQVRGIVDGVSSMHRFGGALSVGSTLTPVSLSATYQTPQAAEQLEVVSDSADDNGASSPQGSGALTVRIHGLTDWNTAATEDVTLNGTTPVATANTWLRVFKMEVLTAGTYGTATTPSHNSTITLRDQNSPQAEWARIESFGGFGMGVSQIACHSLPAGVTAFVDDIFASVQASKVADLVFFVRENADGMGAMRAHYVTRGVGDTVQLNPDAPFGPFTGPCDIGWMARSSAVTGPCNVDISFNVVEYS